MILPELSGAVVIVADTGAWKTSEGVMRADGVGELICMRSAAVTSAPFVVRVAWAGTAVTMNARVCPTHASKARTMV
jgi:hypothetical protein